MVIPVQEVRRIEAILFDMNGTLRMREQHQATQQAAFERITELLLMESPTQAFWVELADRYKAYGRWAQENLLQLSEETIWTRWMLPEMAPQLVAPIAAELTLAWSKRNGRTIPRPGAQETLSELKRRGYRLGVISNSMSSLDIPRSLDAFGWNDLFEVVVLSSMVKCRKPAPEIFWEATSRLRIEPGYCAYIGNHVSKDVVGCKQAGFAQALIVQSEGGFSSGETEEGMRSFEVVRMLDELLEFFPPLVQA